MFWKVLYVFGVLTHLTLGNEVEVNRVEIEVNKDEIEVNNDEIEVNKVEIEDAGNFKDTEDEMTIFETAEIENPTLVEETTDVEEDFETESPTEDDTNFAGPVKAKGTVSVAATFGYDGPASNPFPNTGPFWSLPMFFTQYYYPSSLNISPMPIALSPMPLNSMTFLGSSSILDKARENLFKNTLEVNPTRKDIFLELTPLKDEVILGQNKDPIELSLEEMLEDEVTDIDDFTDYDAFKTKDDDEDLSVADDLKTKETDPQAEGMVFRGFLPASGSVTIAARF